MKRSLQILILGPFAIFWFLIIWVISPMLFLLTWLTEDERSPRMSMRDCWEFSTEGLTYLRSKP